MPTRSTCSRVHIGACPPCPPQVAITWLDMGKPEFVSIETGAYDSYQAGSRFSAPTTNWAESGATAWATQFKADNGGGTIPDVTDPLAMSATQQEGALQVIFTQVPCVCVLGRMHWPP